MQNKTIMVTGGTGYIGSWVVKELLEKGYTVRLALRNPAHIQNYQHLQEIAGQQSGTLEIHKADLLEAGSYEEAVKGADAIIHLASPFTLEVKDAQKELIDPALKGTKNVLGAASRSGSVKRVVLTSSVAAIYGDSIDMQESRLEEFTEAQFNYSSSKHHQPYPYSKVLAEKEAWRIAESQKDWRLVVINPGFVMGPSLTQTSGSESLKFMKSMLSGEFAIGAPELYFGFVDVRDVAHAHVLALENKQANGRFIISQRSMSFVEFAEIIEKVANKEYSLPKRKMPKFVLYLVGWAFGLSYKFIKRNVGYPLRFNNSKSRELLGLEYRPIEKATKDMIDQMEKAGMV